jgi:lysophospholipase L1-like esterase
MKKILAAVITALTANCSNAAESWFDKNQRIHTALAEQVLPGQEIFLGDSITHRFNVALINPFSINFGISSLGAQRMVDNYHEKAVKKAGKVRIMIGVNSIVDTPTYDRMMGTDGAGAGNLRTIAVQYSGVKVVWHGILTPVTGACGLVQQERIKTANHQIAWLCRTIMPDCLYIKPPILTSEHYSDGVHPNAAGYAVIVSNERRIRAAANKK